jgi:peptide deformylase
MALKICKYGEKVLREKTTPVPAVDDAMRAIADEMLETMRVSRGVGLAAQQVGRTERICVIDIPPEECGNWKKPNLLERVRYFMAHR